MSVPDPFAMTTGVQGRSPTPRAGRPQDQQAGPPEVALLPPVWLGPGAVTEAAALSRFGDLVDVPLVVGPVVAGGRGSRVGRTVVHALGVGGVDHEDAPPVGVAGAEEMLGWMSARGLSACLSIRGASTGDLAAVIEQVRRGLSGDAVSAIEVDLRTADEQTVLKSMARVRESAPRGQTLLARLAVQAADDLVTRARSAVAGGATAIVVCGQVQLGPGRWWSGPSTAMVCRSGVRTLRRAAQESRWPGAPLIASGGVYSATSAVQTIREGAAAVQLGTALWADPTLLWRVRDAVRAERAPDLPTSTAGGGRTSGADPTPDVQTTEEIVPTWRKP